MIPKRIENTCSYSLVKNETHASLSLPVPGRQEESQTCHAELPIKDRQFKEKDILKTANGKWEIT